MSPDEQALLFTEMMRVGRALEQAFDTPHEYEKRVELIRAALAAQ